MAAGDWHYFDMVRRAQNTPNRNGDVFLNGNYIGVFQSQAYQNLGVPRHLLEEAPRFRLTPEQLRESFNQVRNFSIQSFQATIQLNEQQLEDIRRWAMNEPISSRKSEPLEEEVDWAKEGF